MSMFYRSTRDDNVKVTASQAILKGWQQTEDFCTREYSIIR